MDELTVRTSETSGLAAAASTSTDTARAAREQKAPPASSPRTAEEPSNPAAGAESSGEKGPGVSREALEAAIATLDSNVHSSNEIRFKLSPDDGELVVQVVDRESDEVIRSIPPERLVEFAERSTDSSTGLLLDDFA